ncbi:MAG: hypothetical protein GOU98_05075 [Candidatus Altiarchaeota archaeon]|nr:hypothetical protein [Candidatus Altiarchaeota archaeon]
MNPTFSAALTSAIDELMLGKYGRPYTLVEVITWLFNQLVYPKHPIGKSFEMSIKEEEVDSNNFLELLKEPKKLRKDLEEFLSPGILNYSTSLEHAMLDQLPWSQLPLEFMMVWIFGRGRWTVETAKPLELDNFKRVAFFTKSPSGKTIVFISASGETDREAEAQGKEAYEIFEPQNTEKLPVYVVTLSKENQGNLKKGNLNFVKLHYLSHLILSKS